MVPGFATDPFARIARKDVMLYHPYQGYDAVEDFARAAARDPKVSAMRATLYRVGDDNVLAESLIEAARAGKDVAVLLEARARFDELQNLEWGLRFQNSGVRVLPLPSRKVHAKAIWVKRGPREFVHLGTGNYNTRNARLYTDFSLFTGDRRLTRDVKLFFDALEHGRTPRMIHLKTSSAIRTLLLERITAEAHPGGHVILKFNHVTDPEDPHGAGPGRRRRSPRGPHRPDHPHRGGSRRPRAEPGGPVPGTRPGGRLPEPRSLARPRR